MVNVLQIYAPSNMTTLGTSEHSRKRHGFKRYMWVL